MAKFNWRRFFCLLFFTFIIENVFGIEIYLSPKGSDSNKGTKQFPLLTLIGARNKIRELRKAGAIKEAIYVIIENGAYYMSQTLELNSEDNGSPQSPVIFKAAEGASPVFYGGVEIKGFKKINDKLWKAFVPQTAQMGWYFEQLFVNDRRAQRAKTPDNGYYNIHNVTEKILEPKGKNNLDYAVQQIRIDSAASEQLKKINPDDYNDVVLNFYHKWDITRKRLQFFNPDNNTITIGGSSMKPWNKLDANTFFSIENYHEALDKPGEWFLSRSGELYYIPLPGETIETSRFFAPTLDQFISIRGEEGAGKQVENIRFENISFKISRYQMSENGNDPSQAAFPIDAVVMVDFAKNISFTNCEIEHTGMYAFWFRQACSRCTVQHCLLKDLGAGGIKIGEILPQKYIEVYSDTLRYEPQDSINLTRYLTHQIKVDNNIITEGGRIFPDAVGICIFDGSENTITHNEISDLYYSGISVGWVWGYSYSPTKKNLIAFNHIHHLGWGLISDMAGIYTLGSSQGTVISNNTIHDIYVYSYGGWGLYADEGSTGILMENNLVYNCNSQGFHQHYGRNNIIRNNIFAFNEKAQLNATRMEKHLSFTFTNNIVYFSRGNLTANNWTKVNIVSDSNCYWDTRTKNIAFDKLSFEEWQKLGKDQHSVVADPLFIAPASYNFEFKDQEVCKKIKFTPFNYTLAGVYGSDEWRKKAAMSKERIEQFVPEQFPGNRSAVR